MSEELTTSPQALYPAMPGPRGAARAGIDSLGLSARPLLVWSAAEREQLGHRLARLWADWLADWQLQPCSAPTEIAWTQIVPAFDVPQLRTACAWTQIVTGTSGGLWCALVGPAAAERARKPVRPFALEAHAVAEPAVSQRPVDAVRSLLYKHHAGGASPWTDAVADDAWKALSHALSELCGSGGHGSAEATQEPLTALFRNWSGALLCEAQWQGWRWLILLDREFAARAVGRRLGAPMPPRDPTAPPLTQLERALATSAVHLTVELADVEVTLGSLLSLGVDSLLCTRHRLDEPMLVFNAEAPTVGPRVPVCAAYPGRRAHLQAVELQTL